MTAHEIIIRPIVSERSFSGMEQNKYTFEVAKDANKYRSRTLSRRSSASRSFA